MANSAAVSAGDLARSKQYNDLRDDVLSTTAGHVHNGTDGRGNAQFILNVAGVPLLTQNTTDAASNEGLRIAGGDRATPADNDEVYISAYLDINTGVQTEFGRITHKALDVTTCTKDSRWEFQQYTANSLREVVVPAITADDTFAMVTLAQTLAGKTLTTPTISSTGWTNANHAHAADNSGATLNASAIAAGTLTHERGGIEADISAITTGGILYGSGSGTMAILPKGSNTQVLTLASCIPAWASAAGGPAQANQAALEAETNEDTYAPPDLLKHSPGVAKVWARWEQCGAHGLIQSYNYTGVCDGGGVGDTDHTFATDFSADTAYTWAGMTNQAGGGIRIGASGAVLAGSITTFTYDACHNNADSCLNGIAFFGDQ